MSANKEVRAVLNASKPRKCLRGSYDSFTPEEKAIIVKKAIENGVTRRLLSTTGSYRIGG